MTEEQKYTVVDQTGRPVAIVLDVEGIPLSEVFVGVPPSDMIDPILVDGVFVEGAAPELVSEKINRIRESWKGEIDRCAEMRRIKFLTSQPGQILTYVWKSMEAAAILNLTGVPVVTEPALLTAQVAITGETLQSASETIYGVIAGLRTELGRIEGVRLKGKTDLALLTTRSEIQTSAQNTILAFGEL